MNNKGFAFDELTKIILWVILLILAGFSIYSILNKYGLR